MYSSFEISLVVFMPNITTNHAITYTNSGNFSSGTNAGNPERATYIGQISLTRVA